MSDSTWDWTWESILEWFNNLNNMNRHFWQPNAKMMLQLIPRLQSHSGFTDVRPAITMVTLYFRVPGRPGDIKIWGASEGRYEITYYRQWKEELSEFAYADDETIIEVILKYIDRLRTDPIIDDKL